MDSIKEYIYFHNNTELPLIIEAWVWINGTSILKTVHIEPYEKAILYSTIGEWYMNTMLLNSHDKELWIKKGLEKCVNIGKFRSKPCIMGNYCWLDWEDKFECFYTEIDSNTKKELENIELGSNIDGLVTLKLKD